MSFAKWFFVASLPFVLTQDYCSVCRDHTMCRFKEKNPACGEDSESGVSQSEANYIVGLHNAYRAKIANGLEEHGRPGPQPPAANMRALIWDDRLAEVAQRWADQCSFLHDQCRNDPRFKVGQNIYWSTGFKEVNWTRAIGSWYSEVRNFDELNVDRFSPDPTTGHYTQVAWATSQFVGCGRTTYGGAYRLSKYRPREFILTASPSANGTGRRAVERQSDAGYFGGAGFDPAGAEGAITSASGEQSSPSGGNAAGGAAHNKPNGGGGRPPSYPSYPPNYPGAGSDPNYPNDEDFIMNVDYPGGDYDDNFAQPAQIPENDYIHIPAGFLPAFDDKWTHPWIGDKWKPSYYKHFGRDQILVCNYGPAGNWKGEPLYEQGTPCSRCPCGTVCQSGLCVPS